MKNMKKIITILLIISLYSCSDTNNIQYTGLLARNNGDAIYIIKINSHEYISKNSSVLSIICHSPDCEYCKNIENVKYSALRDSVFVLDSIVRTLKHK